jgi:hypothetical protein
LLKKYYWTDQIKEDATGVASGTNGIEKNVYMVLVVKHESKRPLGRPMRKREDNIKMDL